MRQNLYEELCAYKILEKIMLSRLSQHLYINKTLLLEQLGFRKGMSNENAAYKLSVYCIS